MHARTHKFTIGERLRIGASLMAPFAILWVLSRSRWVPLPSAWLLTAAGLGLLLGAALPRPFEKWHRGVSATQAWVGRLLIKILLGIVFVLVVVPLGVLLRLAGKSFLDLKPADSYWKKCRAGGSLRDQF